MHKEIGAKQRRHITLAIIEARKPREDWTDEDLLRAFAHAARLGHKPGIDLVGLIGETMRRVKMENAGPEVVQLYQAIKVKPGAAAIAKTIRDALTPAFPQQD